MCVYECLFWMHLLSSKILNVHSSYEFDWVIFYFNFGTLNLNGILSLCFHIFISLLKLVLTYFCTVTICHAILLFGIDNLIFEANDHFWGLKSDFGKEGCLENIFVKLCMREVCSISIFIYFLFVQVYYLKSHYWCQ
jgi:hypothetical protein